MHEKGQPHPCGRRQAVPGRTTLAAIGSDLPASLPGAVAIRLMS
jgi:hypothetical protein